MHWIRRQFESLLLMIGSSCNAEQVVKRFGGKGIIEEQEGFVDSTVMVKKVRRGVEAVGKEPDIYCGP